ncbi:hypothetical protein FJQ53_26720 [Escherichia coli]|jgi:hypothetical protein|uniref:Uncharacterized protein n=1 Tax=Pseudomonas orientalis TaxID=76758 RepID=A0A4Q7CSE5_9PSED|nr:MULTISPECIES: hypothetical protein [Bacteria]EAN4013690.1 hypothetical protein [Salmonella enterica]ECS2020070.1 hypothetical protein [Salmonella enterica subsp. enterica serovar Typhimurium var. 5-]EDA1722594.1 hypothetical protein [Salmonella enterica subsp. enterica serovar Typhimurium]EDN3263735.1 hypothetical protein [Salmonella enterica subsp. enterica serovar Enteritidis]EFX4913738.1 hypothetical protein [Shigella flexneri]EMD0319314.1 hypothetical protein [Shigella sonnei]HBL70519
MKNEDDYKSGWTTQTTNPATGKKCSGGAARNLRIYQAGGANSVRVKAAIEGVQSIQPIIDVQQSQIEQQQVQIAMLTQSLSQAINELTKSRNK